MNLVKLNVGGQILETKQETLIKYPESSLAKIFQQDPVSMQDDDAYTNKTFFIDSDPEYFKLVLTWLRFGVISIPDGCDKKVLKAVASDLGLESMVKQLSATEDVPNPKDKGAMTDWLRLNVGGTIFETSRSTLTSDSCSILSRMFEPNSNLPPATTSTDGVYLIDACPRSFEVILNYLRYKNLILGDVKVDDVLPVTDYFGLSELRELLESHRDKENEEKGRLICVIEDSVEKLDEVLQQVECELTNINEKLETFNTEMSSVASGMDDIWRLKCEMANISEILSKGFKNLT